MALRAITFYGRWESALAILNGLRNILLITAAGLSFWWATGGENFVTDWVREVIAE